MQKEIDFYKNFKLPEPMCGLVSKITSPKGVKKQEIENYVSYHFHSDLICLYEGKATRFEPGIYHVLDIFKKSGAMVWAHYLFIVDTDGEAVPVAEYLDTKDSLWVKKALPIVKAYFNEEPIKDIKLTHITLPKPKRTRWDTVSH